MKITVGMAVFNGGDFLREALDSILSQSHTDFELIVSEGGSTDGTPEILAGYAARDPRIRYERTPERLLQVPNYNRVLELTSTEWIQLMCHDDILLPGALARIVAEIRATSPRVALAGHSPATLFRNKFAFDPSIDPERVFHWVPGSNPFPVDCGAGEPVRYSGPRSAAVILAGGPSPALPALTTATVRRAALKEIGDFDPSYGQFDNRAWLRLLLRWDYLFIPVPLSLTRIHGGQVTARLAKHLQIVEDMLRFWPAFISEARVLGTPIPRRARLLPLLKAASQASILLYVTFQKRQWPSFLGLYQSLPWRLKLAVLFYLPRTMRNELRRTRVLRKHLSFSELYL